METIPFGHFIDVFGHTLGAFTDLSAMRGRFYEQVLQVDSGTMIPKSANDQLLVQGALENGALASIHFRGGTSRGANFYWEINGSEGDLVITSPMGQMQLAPLSLSGGRGLDTALTTLPIPASYIQAAIPEGYSWNVGHLYVALARRLRGEDITLPDFRIALANHRLIERIEAAAGVTSGT